WLYHMLREKVTAGRLFGATFSDSTTAGEFFISAGAGVSTRLLNTLSIVWAVCSRTTEDNGESAREFSRPSSTIIVPLNDVSMVSVPKGSSHSTGAGAMSNCIKGI